MTITRKPRSIKLQTPADIDKLINKGGSAAKADHKQSEHGKKLISLNVPTKILNDLDENLKSRMIQTTRTAWILEAIMEKMKREEI